MVLIFTGTNFRESKIYAFRGYLISRNQQKIREN